MQATLRILKTYFFFVLISLLLMLPIYFKYYSILREREYSVSETMIANGMETVNNQIAALINLSQTTNADNRYRELFAHDMALSRITVPQYMSLNQVQSNFQTLIGTQPMVADAGIYFNSDTILTRSRSIVNYSVDFYNNFFTYGQEDAEGWHRLLASRTFGGFLPSTQITSPDYGAYNGITFICAWPPANTNHYQGILYATIDTKVLLEKLVPAEILAQGSVRLYDSNNNLLLEHQYDAEMEGQTLTLHSGRLSIEVKVPITIVEGRLKPVRNLFFFLILGAFLISLLLACLFAYYNARPIRRLVGMVLGVNSGERQPRHGENEYDFIAKIVANLEQTANTYSEIIASQRGIIQLNIFRKALGDGLHNAQLQREFHKNFPKFPASWQLASFCCDAYGSEPLERQILIQASLLQDITEQLPTNVIVQTDEDNLLVLVLPMDSAPEDFWDPALRDLHTMLTEKYDLDFRVALSCSFCDSRQLSEAYSQLRSIDLSSSGELWSSQQSVVRRISDFTQRSPNLALDFGSMQQLYHTLLAGDEETAKSILEANRQSLHLNGYIDLVFIKQIFYNFRNILTRVKVENCEVLLEVTIPIYNPKASVQEMFEGLGDCCEKICRQICAKQENSKVQFSETVCAFVVQNISNKELYTKMVAVHFGISETTLQKIIRAATGKTFFEYVEGQRLDLAYDLLKNTDKPISEIFSVCGFSSSNSFYKAFKRKYGQPPGVMRNMN